MSIRGHPSTAEGAATPDPLTAKTTAAAPAQLGAATWHRPTTVRMTPALPPAGGGHVAGTLGFERQRASPPGPLLGLRMILGSVPTPAGDYRRLSARRAPAR